MVTSWLGERRSPSQRITNGVGWRLLKPVGDGGRDGGRDGDGDGEWCS